MVVAARTLHRQAHEAVASGHHTVVDAVLPELLRDRATLEGHAMDPVESRRHALVLGRVREQVPGELLGQELVVRLILVESLQHPIAPRPGEHRLVARVAPGVGIAGKVEPADRQMFAVTGRSQHRVDALLIGVGRLIGQEGRHFIVGGRQARQGERRPTEQGGPIGGGGRLETGFGRLGGDECIERISHPPGSDDRRRRLGLRAHESPVGVILGALFHPADQDVFLRLGERAMQLGRRHHVFLIFAQDALHQRAVLEISWCDRHIAAFQLLRRPGKFIET